MLLDVAEKVHPEVIEAKVSDGDTRSDVFEFDDLILEFAQLFFAVSGVRTGRVENVVVTDCGEVGDDHSVLDALFEIDVFVERDVRPEVDQLDLSVERRSVRRSGCDRVVALPGLGGDHAHRDRSSRSGQRGRSVG